jgi:hypothetical protein
LNIWNSWMKTDMMTDDASTCSVIINSTTFNDTSCACIPTTVNGQLWSHIHDQ